MAPNEGEWRAGRAGEEAIYNFMILEEGGRRCNECILYTCLILVGFNRGTSATPCLEKGCWYVPCFSLKPYLTLLYSTVRYLTLACLAESLDFLS